MACVSSRFCCWVRPAYHWIVMFGMGATSGVERDTRSLSRLREPLDLAPAEAADEVVVHHARGLHEGVADRRADEGEAARLELPAQRLRHVGHRRHLPRLPPAILDRPPADLAPHPGVERALGALHGEERARIEHGGRDLGAVAHDALVAPQGAYDAWV